MITYCPSCHTHFRVHAEQLAARAGQVRCGKCSRVFDALEHLVEEIAPARAPRPNPDFEPMRTNAADAEHAPELPTDKPLVNTAATHERKFVPAADAVAKGPAPGAKTPEVPTSELAPVGQTNAKPVAASGASAIGVSKGHDHHDASAFGFGPGAAAERAIPARRWPWLLGVLLLLLILLAQAAYHYRGAVALLFPEIKPYAAALCASLGCELPLPRRTELMSIEASDLQADTINHNIMVLSATLKNRAIFNQQHPLLELTLTDAQDQPVVRRVLAPQDYLGKAVNTQTGFAANTEIAIKVFIEGSEVKATGYRLYLFYP